MSADGYILIRILVILCDFNRKNGSGGGFWRNNIFPIQLSREKSKVGASVKLGFKQNSVFKVLVVGTVLGLNTNLSLCPSSSVCEIVCGFVQRLDIFGQYSEFSLVDWAFCT